MARVIDLSPSHGIDCAQARSYNHIYLFSATSFSQDVIELARIDKRFELVDMKEL